MQHPLKALRRRHLNGEIGGLTAICSSHPMVLQVAFEMTLEAGGPLLVETTPNQVNLLGGYSGMTPSEYSGFIKRLAQSAGLAEDRVFIGADHMGPHLWKHLPAREAMERTLVLLNACVHAGYRKIHLDTAVACADDPGPSLPAEVTAERAARLCQAAEQAARGCDAADLPCYVIGQDVPTPGGGLGSQGHPSPTAPEDITDILDLHQDAFRKNGLESAWQRVMAVVVQPGIDFGDQQIALYDPGKARALSASHAKLPENTTFEVHATDYQPRDALRRLVEDHFCLLKVGPALTFTLRETVYALAHIEAQWPKIRFKSQIIEVMENLMVKHPEHLPVEQRGLSDPMRFIRHFSYRDRVRYYWAYSQAMQAFNQLLQNLTRPAPPLALVRQFLPDLAPDIESGALPSDPRAFIRDRIRKALVPYHDACRSRSC